MAYNPNQPRDERGRWTDGKGFYRANTSYDNLKETIVPLNMEIDEIVPCLRDSATGELVETEVAMVPRKELKNFHSRNGWCVNWSKLDNVDAVFGVYLKNDTEPQGLVAFKHEGNSTYISFACAAPHNNKQLLKGKPPKYTGIGGHLFALVADESAKRNIEPAIFGCAKNIRLLKHYVEVFGAKHIPIIHKYQFIIYGPRAQALIDKYNYTRR